MLALAVTVVTTFAFAFVFFWANTRLAVLGYDGDRFLMAALLLVGAIFLCSQRFRWPEMLLLACAIALFAGCTVPVIISFAVVHPQAWPWLSDQLFYLDTIRPRVWKPAQLLRGLGLCFPIPLFAVVWCKLTAASNRTIQPTAGRRTASL
jgi:hypothetical protein